MTPASSTAVTMRSASVIFMANGLTLRMCLPCFAAATTRFAFAVGGASGDEHVDVGVKYRGVIRGPLCVQRLRCLPGAFRIVVGDDDQLSARVFGHCVYGT